MDAPRPRVSPAGVHCALMVSDDPIRVSLVQPALPAYRVPVFRELAARQGIDLTLRYSEQPDLANATPEGFRAEPVRQTTLRVRGQSLIIVPELLSLATPKRSDVLLAPWNTRSILLGPALSRARKKGVGTVVWGHGFSKRESPKRLALRDRTGCRADAVVFYNRSAADAFRERNPGYLEGGGGVFVAINSLDQTAIQTARADWLGRPEDLAAFRAEHALPEAGSGRPVAIFVSRLMAENRVDLLLEATAKIDDLTTVIIGKGPDLDRLRSIADGLGIADRVRFPGAIYGEPAIAPWFLSAQVFVYPVNIGLSAMHALGYGLPVVTGDDIASHNPEIEAVEHAVNAMLYKDGDVDAMADAIRSVTGDPERHRAMSEAARATVLERFNIPKMVDGLERAIRHAHRRATGDR
jgi:glycosyltransferase involved in cell wall biosynthesis